MSQFFEPTNEQLVEARDEHNAAFIDHAMAFFQSQLDEVNKTIPDLIRAQSKATDDVGIAKAARQNLTAKMAFLKSLKWGMRS